jgi:hypothetical protein
MIFDDFIVKWNTKGIDFDGVYGEQCMDLMHQYVVEVCGLTDGRILAAPAAKDVYINFPTILGNEHFDRIENTPTGVPQKGDIMFWGTAIGQYGHVAIFESGDANTFKSFDQNWNAHKYCETVTHSYNGVLGWLRFKSAAGGPNMYKGYDLSNAESMKVAVDILVRVQSGDLVNKTDLDKQKQLTDNLNQQINDRNNDIVQLNAQITTLNAQVEELTIQNTSLSEQAKKVPGLEAQNTELIEQKTKWSETEKTYNRQVAQLKSDLVEAKKNAFNTCVKNFWNKLFHRE